MYNSFELTALQGKPNNYCLCMVKLKICPRDQIEIAESCI